MCKYQYLRSSTYYAPNKKYPDLCISIETYIPENKKYCSFRVAYKNKSDRFEKSIARDVLKQKELCAIPLTKKFTRNTIIAKILSYEYSNGLYPDGYEEYLKFLIQDHLSW